jgi:hypothetical protein
LFGGADLPGTLSPPNKFEGGTQKILSLTASEAISFGRRTYVEEIATSLPAVVSRNDRKKVILSEQKLASL